MVRLRGAERRRFDEETRLLSYQQSLFLTRRIVEIMSFGVQEHYCALRRRGEIVNRRICEIRLCCAGV